MTLGNPETRNGIIAAVDGSEFSDAAVRWAAVEASSHGEVLTLLTVVPRVDINRHNARFVERLNRLHRVHARTVVNLAREIACTATGNKRVPDIATEFVTAYSVVGALVDASRSARMIVVGCRGLGAYAAVTLGSVSTALLHHAHCPVAVIHNEIDDIAPNAPVLLGVDGSPASELATALAFDEASRRRAPLHAVHAWADTHVFGQADWMADEQWGREALSERLAGWGERYPDVTVHPHLIYRDAARWLVDQSEQAQLIVVGSHGRGGFTGMLLGSVSSTVAQAARVPVLVARTD